MAGVASLITRPFREMGKGAANASDALLKRGAFSAAGAFERVGGFVGGVTKGVLNLASASTVYYPALILGGTIKGSGQMIKGFAKGLGGSADDAVRAGTKGLKRKKLGQAAAEATSSASPLTRQQASGRWSWNDADGSHYYRQVHTKAKVDANGNVMKDADGNIIRERTGVDYYKDSPIGRQHITGEEYGTARKKWINSLPDESEIDDIADIAADVSETAAGDGAGVNLWQFMSDHPVMGTAGMLGGGMLLGEFLDED